jgi:hypothetical protein
MIGYSRLGKATDGNPTKVIVHESRLLYWFSENRNFAFERVARF